jgi:hypothetical protein
MNVDLLRLLTVFGRINPAIWDVIVPMGPRYFESVAELSPASAVEFNPQPIPPGHQIQFAAARAAQEIGLAALGAEAAGTDDGASRLVSRAVDDWCGTPTGHIPIPWPRDWPIPSTPDPDPQPLDIAAMRTVAAMTLASMASRIADGEAREALAGGAEQLLDTALSETRELAAV